MGNNSSHTYPQNVPGSTESEDRVRISAFNGRSDDDEATTVYEAFQRGQRLSANGPFLGLRPSAEAQYQWLSYGAVSEMADTLGAGLLARCGLESGARVGLLSQNRAEWIVVDQACVRFSLVSVPMASSLGSEAIKKMVKETRLSVVIVDRAERLGKLTEHGGDLSRMKSVVLMDGEVDEITKLRLDELGWKLLSYESVMEAGRESPQELRPAKPDDVYTIAFTSGTSGPPKAVVVTQKAMAFAGARLLATLDQANIGIRPPDVFFSFLPLAHFYERLAFLIVAYHGCRAAFYHGDTARLLNDCQVAQPTVFNATPRVLERIYDDIHRSAAQSAFRRMCLRRAAASKLADMERGLVRSNTVWDRTVFARVREMFGGRVRHINIGGDHGSSHIINFFRAALGCSVSQMYGLTETLLVSASAPYDFRGNHVGGPMPGTSIKLVDVPELGYSADKGYGEVCVRGPSTFREYLHNKEASREAVDGDGWVRTGDVGTFTWQGNLRVLDRRQDMFKLARGEYISPAKVEAAYRRCPLVAQVFADGLSDKNFLVAIVVPDFEMVAAVRGRTEEKEEVCQSEEVRRMILGQMRACGRENGLCGVELVRRIHLHPQEFGEEEDLVTPTLKPKREHLKKRFADDIKRLYEEA